MNNFEIVRSCLNEHFLHLNLEECISIREFILEGIDEKKELMKENFKKKVMDEATQLGIDIKFDSSIPTRKILEPKYRNPDNPNDTWTGRGKKPKWLSILLESGISLESLLIQSDSTVDAEVGF